MTTDFTKLKRNPRGRFTIMKHASRKARPCAGHPVPLRSLSLLRISSRRDGAPSGGRVPYARYSPITVQPPARALSTSAAVMAVDILWDEQSNAPPM